MRKGVFVIYGAIMASLLLYNLLIVWQANRERATIVRLLNDILENGKEE